MISNPFTASVENSLYNSTEREPKPSLGAFEGFHTHFVVEMNLHTLVGIVEDVKAS